MRGNSIKAFITCMTPFSLLNLRQSLLSSSEQQSFRSFRFSSMSALSAVELEAVTAALALLVSRPAIAWVVEHAGASRPGLGCWLFRTQVVWRWFGRDVDGLCKFGRYCGVLAGS